MLEKLFPKERDFFPIFNQMTQGLSAAISELLSVIENPQHTDRAVINATKLDSQAELLARRSIEHLHETFITPFDRRHIFQFVTQMGQINSLAKLFTEKLQAYQLKDLPLELIEIALKAGEACAILKQVIIQLQKLKNPHEALKLCLKLYKIRAEGEVLFFRISKDLYQKETNVIRVLQLKEVSEDLVSIVRRFEGISSLVEEIILEYA